MSEKYQWHPWPEEEPEEHETISGHLQSDLVLVTIINHENDDVKFVDIAKTRDGEWQSVSLEDGEIPEWCEVIAWMNLPEPYRTRTNLPKAGNRAYLSHLK